MSLISSNAKSLQTHLQSDDDDDDDDDITLKAGFH